MGVWISIPAAAADSSWTDLLIESATVSTGPFTQINDITYSPTVPTTQWYDEQGTASTWYRAAYYDSVSQIQSPYCPVFQAASTTFTYTTPDEVATLLQMRTSQGFTGFDAQTRPTIQEVIGHIQDIEDKIDYDTGHAWRTRFSQSASGSDTASPRYEYYEQGELSHVSAGLRVKLRNRSIIDFSAAAGDVFQCFNGNTWQDFLLFTSGRENGNWWLDNTEGVLWILNFAGADFTQSVRLKYRYGEESVPGDIRHAATHMVAAEIATGDDRSFMIPEGGDHIILSEKVRIWEDEAKEILAHRAEIKVFS